jgi:alkaline phosphatase
MCCRGSFRQRIFALAAIFIISCGQASYGRRPRREAKNIVVMISDGCGYNHVDAASFYEYGRTGAQVYERFDIGLGMSTYAAGQSYNPGRAWNYFGYVSATASDTDSAAAATAMSTGVKTYKGAVGVDLDRQPLRHIIDTAEQRGKATGVITSVQLSHATPAGFVAHNKSRDNYEQLAKQMLYESRLEVIMGCGHPLYDDDGTVIAKPKEYKYVGGRDTWKDLSDGSVTGCDADGDGRRDDWTVIHKRADFLALIVGNTPKRVIGLAKKLSTLQQRRSGDAKAEPFTVAYNGDVPTLEEMTKASLNILDEDPDGFFLMVEGGAVDWASHKNQSGRLIEEQIDFNKSVRAVVEWVALNSNWRETLIIVTADHECGYLTGPKSGVTRNKPVWNSLVNRGVGRAPEMEWHSTHHTNALVPFYAIGAGSRRFKRLAQQYDSVRGQYLDNTCVAEVIFGLLVNHVSEQD